ncbi:MAG: nitroreductase family protein [Acidimicrobiia bacterium]
MIDVQQADLLLTTTRSVRKRLDFDRPVPLELIEECLEVALQAPTGSNQQGWHFLVIDDPAKKAALADIYQRAMTIYAQMRGEAPTPVHATAEEDPRAASLPGVVDSALYLTLNFARVPVFVLACVEGRAESDGPLLQASLYGSILPAAWSFMLAARARGLGSAWTTLHLMFEEESRALLGIPDHVTQGALIPVGYYLGETFRPAPRLPVRSVASYNAWAQPLP